MSRWPRFRRHLVRGVIVVYVMGCYSWQSPRRMGPEELIATARPDAIRVTIHDLARLDIAQPHIARDSLFGTVIRSTSRELQRGDSVAIAVAHLTRTEIRRLDGVGTTVGIVGSVLAVGMAVLAVAASSMDSGCTITSGSGY